MKPGHRGVRGYTRRELGQIALGAVPAALGVAATSRVLDAAAIDSRIRGVQIGAITYSFRAISNAHEIIKAMQSIGLGEVELMSNHAEALAGAPAGTGAADALRDWRQRTRAAADRRPRRLRADVERRVLQPRSGRHRREARECHVAEPRGDGLQKVAT